MIGLIGLVLILNGCSAFLALRKNDNPDLGVLRIGTERTEIEKSLGEPIKTKKNDDGLIEAKYRYVVSGEPSLKRAMMHGIASVLTFFIYDLQAGIPYELSLKEQQIRTITYDDNNRAYCIN